MSDQLPINLQNIASIVSFVAPGYFAILVYRLAFTKKERDFSHLLIESVIYSLPIVTLTNIVWEKTLHHPAVSALNIRYSALLILVSLIVGGIIVGLRVSPPVREVAEKLGFGSPDEDFVKVQFLRLARQRGSKVVTVRLKSGATFSATPNRANRYSHNGLNYYSFTNLAWYDKKKKGWDVRTGNIIVERNEIEYIETSSKLKD